MDTKKYKIGVLGLGPVGLILSYHFKEVGCNVAVCDMLPRKNKIG